MIDESAKKDKVNTNGIGLGLVISKLIVSKFNGIIDFKSTFGQGSSFYFSFEIENINDELENSLSNSKSISTEFEIDLSPQ